MGGLLGGILEGLSVGLKAMADPMILLGAGILGGSIALIGAGIAGATWIMGAAMPKLAEGLQAFTDVDGEKLKSTGMGMLAIAGGLAAMGAAEIVKGLGGLVSGLTSWFTEDPIAKFKRFGEIAEPLQKSADAMAAFADSYPKSMAAINNAVFDTAAMDSLDKLKELFAGDGFFASIGTWLTGDSDFITKLSRFGELSEPLGKASVAMAAFADSYPKSMAAINNAVFDTAAMDSLDKLKELFAGDGFFASIGTWLTGDSDFITKLSRFGELSEPLGKASVAMSAFSIAYPNFIETINSNMMDPQALANIDKLKDALSNSSVFSVFGGGQTASSPGIFGALFGSSTPDAAAPAAAPAAATAQTTAVRTAPATPDQRHQQMMDMLSKLNDNMASLVTMEDRQIRVLSDGFSGISGVVH